jgi:tripartite-type tricarboxylate transporter receptor subunit TctC
MRRRTFAALGCASAMSRAAAAQAPWPSKPVHIICGFSVGTTTDLLARLLAERL